MRSRVCNEKTELEELNLENITWLNVNNLILQELYKSPLKENRLLGLIFEAQKKNKKLRKQLEDVKKKLFEGNYSEAKEMYNILVNPCPITLFSLEDEIKIGKSYEEMKKYFQKLLKANNKTKKTWGLNNLIYLEMLYKNYREVFLLIKEYMKTDLQILYFEQLLIFICKELNIFISDYQFNEKKHYFIEQIISYSYEAALCHVACHCKKNNEKDRHSVFSDGINYEILFDSVIDKCTTETLVGNHVVNKYHIYFEGIGKNGENYLEVHVIPNTQQIVNMFPTNESDIKLKKLVK